MSFIYVFNSEARDELLKLGLNMLKEDLRQQIFVFENPQVVTFSMPDISYILSDTLTF